MKPIHRVITALNRLSVAQKLGSAFAIMLILTGVVGLVGLISLARVEGQAHMVADKWLAGMHSLASTRTAMLELRELEVKHSRTDDRSYQSEYEEKMTAAAKTATTATEGYASLPADDKDRSLLAQYRKASAAYIKSQQQVVALGRDRKRQDAADYSDGAASSNFDEALGSLDKLIAFNYEGGKATAQATSTVYAQASLLMYGLLAGLMLLGVLLAFGITVSLLRQLGGEPLDAATLAQNVAAGDLSAQAVLRPGDQTSLMAQLKLMQDSLANVVGEVRTHAEGVAAASAEMAQGNADLSTRTQRQADALEKTSASMDELAGTVRQNAENARLGNQLAMKASTVAQRGGAVVGQVVETMRGINESSRRISEIISVIDGIAFQTNILALNAAVEAARAGEQGRGFAVVASEVRSLAGRSAEAAREIKALIGASVERVEQGTALVDQAGTTMAEVVDSIRRVTDIMGEISAASNEQSAGVAQVGDAITQMDQATQQNAALVQQGAASAEGLSKRAEQLVESVAVFRLAPGDAPTTAAAPQTPEFEAAGYPQVERRGPDRARNVMRLSGRQRSDTSDPVAAAG